MLRTYVYTYSSTTSDAWDADQVLLARQLDMVCYAMLCHGMTGLHGLKASLCQRKFDRGYLVGRREKGVSLAGNEGLTHVQTYVVWIHGTGNDAQLLLEVEKKSTR